MPDAVPPGPRSLLPGAMLLRRTRQGMLPMLESLQREYGDVVRFRAGRRTFYLLSDPEAIREVLVTRAGHFIKSPILRSADLVLGQGLLLSEGDLHRRQRKLMQPAFHAQRVAAYADDIVAIAGRRIARWTDGQILDTAAEMTQLTLLIIARILFHAALEAEVAELSEAMSVTVTMFDRARSPWRWLLDRLPLESNRRFIAAVERLHAMIDRFIAERIARAGGGDVAGRAGQGQDLLSLLLGARDEAGEGMSPQLVRDEAITLFAAGHETTANAMVWTWHLLAKHPEVESRLHEELDALARNEAESVRPPAPRPDGAQDAPTPAPHRDEAQAVRPPEPRAIGSPGVRAPAQGLLTPAAGAAPFNASHLPDLRYTRAVLAESMRLYPPAWIVARECVADVDIGGYLIPRGALVLMSQWIVHRQARWWPDPQRFDPSRWLDDRGERPRYAYFPFGGGARQCIGEPLAWMEGTLLLATIGRDWRLRRVDDQPVRLHPTITLRPRDPLLMRLERR